MAAFGKNGDAGIVGQFFDELVAECVPIAKENTVGIAFCKNSSTGKVFQTTSGSGADLRLWVWEVLVQVVRLLVCKIARSLFRRIVRGDRCHRWRD